MKIALLCSGLGNVHRGHETFARGLFDLLRDSVDITLFKGGGDPNARELVIDHVPRASRDLEDVHVAASPKWTEAAKESERLRIEGETFAYAALKPLLAGGYDVIHCLEKEVCNVVHANRHLFGKTPKILFSNGGAIRGHELPNCDFVQEHTAYNLSRSRRDKAFMIPHGVDTARFRPGVSTDYRARHGIPADAFVAISVGTICYWHKRMDYVIRETAAVDGAWLVIVGQSCPDTPAIVKLGQEMMGSRVVFDTIPNDQLPGAYAAADVFVLGSLFETFGIVYVEAMAMGLPVICTNHRNQQEIVKDGIFVDMAREGALAGALRDARTADLGSLRERGRQRAVEEYDLQALKRRYVERYAEIARAEASLPKFTTGTRIRRHVGNAFSRARRLAG